MPPGLGYKIFDILIGIAQKKRLERIYGIVLTENRRILYICYKSGFKAEQLPEGLKDEFLGIPRSLIVKTLEMNNHQIVFDFILEGSLENPKFNFRGSLVNRFTIGLAKTLGLSVIEAGETVIIQGDRAIRGVGKGLKEMEKELQKPFK